MQADFDVAIVGSGFAGSLLALVARRLGLSVLLLEKGSHPRFAIGGATSPPAKLPPPRPAPPPSPCPPPPRPLRPPPRKRFASAFRDRRVHVAARKSPPRGARHALCAPPPPAVREVGLLAARAPGDELRPEARLQLLPPHGGTAVRERP